VTVRDIVDEPLKFIAAHEELAVTNIPSATNLFTAFFNLFGGV
jgi:hypothetical protein